MKIEIEPSNHYYRDGVRDYRIWNGVTSGGNKCEVVVAFVACTPSDEKATKELEAALGSPHCTEVDDHTAYRDHSGTVH